MLKEVKVFISSPGNLVEERSQFPRIITLANEVHVKLMGFIFTPIDSASALVGMGRPQKLINTVLAECDIVVFLLWKRWGSPTGTYSSGFEEEYEFAKSLYTDNGKPEIWMYFRQVPPEELVEPDEQLKSVLNFKKKIMDERLLLYAEYEHFLDWEHRLLKDLCSRIDKSVRGKYQSTF